MALNVAQYLFARLKEAGVESVHGVPGDYNLKLLDHVALAGLDWVGNCNELNAAYAADGYARIKGIGAIVTAFGVGELSALNGVGGAYTEKSPVFVVVGTPLLKAQADGVRLHHSLCNGRPDDFEVFANMHSAVTVAQEVIKDSAEAPRQIKRLIRECIIHSRPVYLRVPMDMVGAIIPESAPEYSTTIEFLKHPSNPTQEQCVCDAILERFRSAKTPLIRVDVGAYRYGLRDITDRLIQATGFPAVTTPMGKGAADETVSNFHGIMTPFPGSGFMPYFQSTDLVVDIGQLACDNNSYYFRTLPDPSKTIAVSRDSIAVDGSTFETSSSVVLELVLAALGKEPLADKPTSSFQLPNPVKDLKGLVRPEADKPLAQDYFWRLISHFFKTGDIIIVESGTAQHGSRECVLPAKSTMLASGAWLSIGWALCAAQGAALALPQIQAAGERGRTILFQGDGSFQMVAQELSTILRKKLNLVFFLINNDGYTIERFIHGPEEAYNDIHMWNYLDAPAFFQGKSTDDYPITTSRARTWGELDEILKRLGSQPVEGFHMVEIIMAANDVPMGLRKVREIPSSIKTY